jgi:hypothetical protein
MVFPFSLHYTTHNGRTPGSGESSRGQMTAAVRRRLSGSRLETSQERPVPADCKLPVAEKNKILSQIAEGNDPHLSMRLLRRFRESRGKQPSLTASKENQRTRTVAALLAAAGLGDKEKV